MATIALLRIQARGALSRHINHITTKRGKQRATMRTSKETPIRSTVNCGSFLKITVLLSDFITFTTTNFFLDLFK